MAQRNLIGTMALTKTSGLYDTWDIRLKLTTKQRAAFEQDPERIMTEFLTKRGFKVNSMRFVKRRSSTVKRMRNIDVVGAKHVHSGRSKSGWV